MEDITTEVDGRMTADAVGVHLVDSGAGEISVPRFTGVSVQVEAPEHL